MNSVEWWANCFPQWRGQNMTTANGQPSVQPSATDLGEQLQDPGIAATQASAAARAGGERPNIVGQYMDDVDSQSTEGATVSNDQTQMGLTAPVDADDND